MKHQNNENSIGCELAARDRVVAAADSASDIKAYETPVLISYGDVRDITLGGTLGMGESGAGFEFFEVIRP